MKFIIILNEDFDMHYFIQHFLFSTGIGEAGCFRVVAFEFVALKFISPLSASDYIYRRGSARKIREYSREERSEVKL